MIPVLIEPSNFIYKINNSFSLSNSKVDIEEFSKFVLEVKSLLDLLDKYNYKIATTQELSAKFIESVPIPVYQTNAHPIYKLARQVVFSKLSRLLKIVHEYGDHELNYDFDFCSIDTTLKIHNHESYLHWKDLLGLIILNKLPPVVLKSNNITIFNNTFFNLKDNLQITPVDVVNNLTQLSLHKEISTILLCDSINKIRSNGNIQCSGTGTHSSMWGYTIRNINDIPPFERTLFTKLVETGLINRIKFLDFNNQYPSAAKPYIEIKEIKCMENSDQIIGVLRGKGTKQNGQRIILEVNPGIGAVINRSFNSEITLENLEFIFNLAASSKEI
ncbi:hypothetical protein [Peribacillus frigoritolerans]|uniref:hypothetical protein n=1 Tax=Peribacillus frigoritolerans TaxID=450367 RepID=UPI001059F0C8|nr:hypothetical protein [Peribacillus frigoritolerans]TDL76105.1 hypothetical protein E2R53_20590 [Peribacillus frigoritolerans]